MGKFEVCEPDEFLCPHQISALNKKYLDEYAYEEDHDVFMMHIESIKKQADLYLAFSKNSRNI